MLRSIEITPCNINSVCQLFSAILNTLYKYLLILDNLCIFLLFTFYTFIHVSTFISLFIITIYFIYVCVCVHTHTINNSTYIINIIYN